MEKTYNPHSIEPAINAAWQQAHAFQPQGSGQPYCIMLPPPNVTGSLHMGHGFQDTLIDILIRYHRMSGDKTLWQPGTDHAGIATQMVVERLLSCEDKTRHDLGREAFTERVWQWKADSGNRIEKQMQRLGASCDWSRARFTMDDDLSAAVRKAFIKLYDDGLIYRGQRLVNWDPVLLTAVSDLEVLNEEEQGSLWHIRYSITNTKDFLVVATTRPETLLGDAAVAVHPDDKRYKHLIGQTVTLPLANRPIPIIADEHVDPTFGTGCVKITPAHDFNDYAVGQRHDLPLINILTTDAKLNDAVPDVYQGLDRFIARKQIIQDLTARGLLDKTEAHTLKIPRGDRSGAVIEPYLTEQWYVKTEPLAAPARDAVRNQKIQLIPENAENLYFEWMDNIQDWCISRQLWWGHRIPAWYDEQGNVYVGESEESIRKQHQLDHSTILKQDEDVLDTWFSSALWPFATLGWPNDTQELQTFYPTNVLVTGFDIIFFWVARMIMFGLYFMKAIPFKTVYLHGLIRDHDGQKMSKTKGNVIDPVDLIDGIDLQGLIQKRTAGMMQEHLKAKVIKATKKQFPDGIAAYGTDAVRFTYCALASRSRDINFDVKRLEGYRNFCNKLWNAARFVLINVSPALEDGKKGEIQSLADQWILSRLQKTIIDCHQHIADYRFDHLAQTLYEFVWNEYCDWYLEMSKVTRNDAVLLQVLVDILKLAQPIIPFITQAIWQSLPPALQTHKLLAIAPYPQDNPQLINEQVESEVTWMQSIVTGIRNIRSEIGVSPAKQIDVMIKGADAKQQQQLLTLADMLKSLARLNSIELLNQDAELPATASCFIDNVECHIPMAGLIDIEAEKQRLVKEISKVQQEIKRLKGKLDNQAFVAKAPEAVVQKEKEKLLATEVSQQQLETQLQKLG